VKSSLKYLIVRCFDLVVIPALYFSAIVMKLVRRGNLANMPLSKRILLHVGVFPIRDHYYEPLFDSRRLRRPLSDVRSLPGIEWNEAAQLELLQQFHFAAELRMIPFDKPETHAYYFNNGAFGLGDAEFLYNIIRLKKPRRIVEIGSGFSTLMAIEAIRANYGEDGQYQCEHICIEPYEMPWLEQAPVRVIRQRVEESDPSLFFKLEENDILFIDSSHMIRPQGDVLFEYLEILPTLKIGVIVHIHDIFSPRDYPASWVVEEVRFWNEQYLLEAFLSHNRDWKIIGAVNFLHQSHFDALSKVCPRLVQSSNPGSFYMQRV
jgi:hypothetical protein